MSFEVSGDSILFLSLVAGFAVFVLWQRIRKGSFRGALFNARLVRTLGKIQGSSIYGQQVHFTVHALETEGNDARVGIEIYIREVGGFTIYPAKLSASAALELSELLRIAAQPQDPTYLAH